jgi:hypothetical protein
MYGECTVNVRWMYGECTVNVREPTLVLFSHSKPLQRDTRPCIHAQRTPPPDFNVGGSWPRWSSPAGTQADHSILKWGGGPLSTDTRSRIQTSTRRICMPRPPHPMSRCVELLSGAYLDYYYHCTVIVVSWYVPNGDLRGGAFCTI